LPSGRTSNVLPKWVTEYHFLSVFFSGFGSLGGWDLSTTTTTRPSHDIPTAFLESGLATAPYCEGLKIGYWDLELGEASGGSCSATSLLAVGWEKDPRL
jgi:hypothetical protein